MVVISSRASLLFALLVIPALTFPAFTFQADLDGPSVRIGPIRSRENRLAPSAPGDTAFPEATLRMDTSLVLIPAQVTKRDGSPIVDLKRGDFKIFEDGAEQEITYFATHRA